ncbi:hypothetical protein NVP1253O_47 [Vibrio phage 1.253.O._10N.286.45.B12]|nr:hypothetical protein NVP1235O_47 [Vibrio phage 1.235.O._10N.261.52.B2]AUR98571.1 hypothetical protein NVP1253O_47 [Vibrio phage 1.253.O._10N.286.45.B12]
MNANTYALMAIDVSYHAVDSKGIPCMITKKTGLVKYGSVAVKYEDGLTCNKRYDFFTLS